MRKIDIVLAVGFYISLITLITSDVIKLYTCDVIRCLPFAIIPNLFAISPFIFYGTIHFSEISKAGKSKPGRPIALSFTGLFFILSILLWI